MKIILAGYNVDLDGLKQKELPLTPETFSAAYARISRSPKSIPELRAIARNEIKKAREQNRRIIFEMGHHSIAEHAVFNFDIIGISRFAVEHLEAHRLNSYTEASQRYIKLQSNFLVPDEIKKTKLLPLFLKTIKFQNYAYQYLTEKLNPSETKSAKIIEDTRYVTSLATTTQLGMTINARNLELMIRRFASSNIAEINKLGKELYKRVIKVAPSIILFYKPTKYDKDTYKELKKLTLNDNKARAEKKTVKLVDY
ncbi:MAG: FAD-dependent thymidylate synthase, partial [candidate division WOR-3 bacterium]